MLIFPARDWWLASGGERLLVVSPECRQVLPAHVALEHGRLGFSQVNHDQSVEDIREFPIDVEAKKFPPDFCVLLQQNRQPLAVKFHVRDRI